MIFRTQTVNYAVLILAAVLASAAPARAGGPILVLADGPNGAEKADIAKARIDGSEWSEAPVVQSGLTISVLFKDPDNTGFRDAALGAQRRARLYDALRYVAETLRTGGELNLVVGPSESDGTGPLAQGGPMFPSEDGVSNGSVFQRLSTGTIPYPTYAELSLTFDWGYAWHIGTAPPSADTLDLWSVAVHEITHSLGFISLMSANGASHYAPENNTYSVFDSLLAESSSLSHLLGGTTATPVFEGASSDLAGGRVVFAGTAAMAAFGAAPPIYSSSPFKQGTSLQHWAEASVPGAVMGPTYSYGAMRRQYSAADIAVLRDIGWTGAEAPERGPCPIQSVALVEPSQSSIAADASNWATVQLRAAVVLDASDSLCEEGDGVLRVEYFVDGVSCGASGDGDNHFPLNAALNVGTHKLRADATRTDSSAVPLKAERTVTVTAAVVPPSPVIKVTPAVTETDFGEVNTGAHADAVYTVMNNGGAALNGAASLSGAAQFQFVGASTYSLATGASTTIAVRFTPGKKGGFSGTLSFGGNGGSVTVALTGAGVKTGGTFNCAGGRETPGADAADLMVALLASAALLLARRGRMARLG